MSPFVLWTSLDFSNSAQAEDWMAYARQMEEILEEFLKEMPQASHDFRGELPVLRVSALLNLL